MGQPEVQILKIAKGSEFVFKAKVTVMPEVELPDYKEIASKIKGKEVSVSEEEVEDALNYLQKSRAKFVAKSDAADKKDFVEIEYQNKDINEGKATKDQFVLGEGGFMPGFEESIVGMKAGEEKEFKAKFLENSARQDLAGKEGDFKVKLNSVQKMELPEISDEFAKSLGGFDSLNALRDNIKEGVTIEKGEAEKQRRRSEILDRIAEQSKFEVPESMVEYEQTRLLEDLKNRITQNMKISFEQYLAAVKQTEAQIKETYKKEAEKRLKEFLVLREIGKRENIQVSEEEADQEVEKSIKNYSKDQISKIDISQLKEYTKGVILNEKIFQKLENLSS
jgi:trigger factor